MAFEVLALLTDEMRRREAEHWTIGASFQVVSFVVGAAGHDPLDPTTALAPDPGQTECLSPVFGPKAVANFTYANDACPIWECVVEPGEGVALISSVCLLAQILTPVPGDTFLFAVANFPRRPKLDSERLVLRIGVQR
jgi:hypothetical protein